MGINLIQTYQRKYYDTDLLYLQLEEFSFRKWKKNKRLINKLNRSRVEIDSTQRR